MSTIISLEMEVVTNIKKLLADLQMQYHNLRNFHWNVTGPNFYILHEKFEELYTDIAVKIDDTAERILALGQKPGTSIQEYSSLSDIQDGSGITVAEQMVEEIIAGNDVIIQDVNHVLKISGEAGDEGTVDTFSSYLTELQKINWMLKAFLG